MGLVFGKIWYSLVCQNYDNDDFLGITNNFKNVHRWHLPWMLMLMKPFQEGQNEYLLEFLSPSLDKIPCRASPWWTRRHPPAPRWARARSWARPETETGSSDVTPSLQSLLHSLTTLVYFVGCLSTNNSERSLQTNTLRSLVHKC